MIKRKELEAFAREAAKSIKTEISEHLTKYFLKLKLLHFRLEFTMEKMESWRNHGVSQLDL